MQTLKIVHFSEEKKKIRGGTWPGLASSGEEWTLRKMALKGTRIRFRRLEFFVRDKINSYLKNNFDSSKYSRFGAPSNETCRSGSSSE